MHPSWKAHSAVACVAGIALAIVGLGAWPADAAEQAAPDEARLKQAEARLLEIGKVSPDFTLPVVTGGEVTLANSLQFGKAVLVCFFSLDEAEGGAELTRLQKLHDELESKGLSTIAVNPVDEAPAIKAEVEKRKLQFIVTIDGKETNRAVTHVYRAKQLPTYYLLDKDSKVLWRAVTLTGGREAALREAIAKAGIR